MEQPNMMPNGMGGGNNMNMALNTMQRPQSGNPNQQIHAAIMQHLRDSIGQLPQGWQQTFDIRERANRIMQMVTQLRFLDPQINKCVNIAESWELKVIAQHPNKEGYFAEWDRKLMEITRKRQGQAATNGLGMPQMGNMHNMNQQNGMNGMNGMAGMNNMNFNGMGMNMPNGGMGMPNQMNMGPQGGFPQQLQRQMQPTPMPPQNQQPQNGSIDPSALTQNPQMSNHMPNQMSQPTPQQRQQAQQHQGVNPNQGGPPNGPSENEVKQLAKRMFDATSDEQRKQMRVQVINSLNDQQKAQLQARGMDPLHKLFLQRAREQIVKQRQQQQNAGMGMGGMGNMPQNTQPGQPNFDFSSIMGQQANAIKSQESGGEVVPASNNNNNSNNAMQQGNNQQAMMNFKQNGGNQQMQQMQFAAMQEKQKREQMAKQNQLAQQQAMAQQNQLRGQPGGLNAPNALNGGQVNSPAMNMNMLNRPTFPPGQATPSTPHQNQGMQNHSQTPSTGATQLQQHHQNMLNQNQMGLDGAQRQFLNNLPLEAQQKLAAMAPQDVNRLLQRYAAQRQGAMMPPGAQRNNQNPGMPMGMGGQPMQNHPQMGPGGMGHPGLGFNSQPPPNQQQGQAEPQPGMQQKLQHHQSAQLRQRAMDLKPFPKLVVSTLALAVPDFVNTWGKLRQHIAQNQSVLPQGLMERLTSMQNQWYESHPDDLKDAIEQLKRMVFAQSRQGQAAAQGQQQGFPQGMQMPNGQAPQAQMVAPQAQMQPQPPAQAPENQFISQENVNLVRTRIPAAKAMTDDQIREMMRKRRYGQQAQANPDMQQSLRNAQMNASSQQQQRPQQMMGGGQQAPQQPGPRPQQGQQAQGQKRGNSDDVVEIPNPNAPTGSQQMQQNQQQRGMPPMPNVAGLKTREELAAMPAEQRNHYLRRMAEMQALRRAQIDIGANQQQPQNAQQAQHAPPPQQPPQQQGRQPGGPNQPSPELQQQLLRIRQIYAEVQSSNPKGPDVQLDARSTQQARDLLKKLYPIAHTLDKTLIAGFRAFGEDKVREAIKIKQIIIQNAADAEGNIQDYLGVSLETLKRSEQFIGGYLKELRARQQAQQQAQGGQGQANAPGAAQQPQKQFQPQPGKQSAPAAPQKAQAQAQPPLNRKNSSQHARKASQNKAPPAPTENKTFDWASPTPHGVPKYDPGRTELTADKLKFPPQKKRKTTDSQGSTPAAQTGTPGATGASPQVPGAPKRESPEQMRKMPPQMPEPEKPRFACDDMFCQASAQGFESEELLRKHKEEEHKPIEDPFQFLMDTVDSGLTAMGMDQNGNALPTKANAGAQTARRPPAAQKVVDRKAAVGNGTIALKTEGATPATPASAGKGAVKPGMATPAGKKAAETKAPAEEKEKTLYEGLIEQMGLEQPLDTASKPSTAGAPARAMYSPFSQQLADALHDDADAAGEGDEMRAWDGVDWNTVSTDTLGLPWPAPTHSSSSPSASPELTPPSSVGSSRQSNAEITISEAQRLKMVFEWDPAGNGDTAVPERLQRMVLHEQDQGKDGVTDGMDWSEDLCQWDALFGAQSGLGADDGGFAECFGAERDGFLL